MRLRGQFSKFFYMGLYYVVFTFAFDTTLIQLEMTEIWPKYLAQAFLSPPLDRVKVSQKYFFLGGGLGHVYLPIRGDSGGGSRI